MALRLQRRSPSLLNRTRSPLLGAALLTTLLVLSRSHTRNDGIPPECKLRAREAAAAARALKARALENDFVVVLTTSTARLPVARAARSWIKGSTRTFIAINELPSPELVEESLRHNETFGVYPDNQEQHKTQYPGDDRAALAPFLAHAHLGDTYKWLLYGDDDTIFFPDNVRQLLEGFDPELPYFITDNFWQWVPHLGKFDERWQQPARQAPRCLPCHLDRAPTTAIQPGHFPAPRGCPCTPGLLCGASASAPWTAEVLNKTCDPPWGSYHGGAGAIMSVGLMRRVNLEGMEACVKSVYSEWTGGDFSLGRCLWKAGFAPTDPGSYILRGQLLFDPVKTPGELAQKLCSARSLNCNTDCKLQLKSIISLHASARQFRDVDEAAAFIEDISYLHQMQGFG